ncbi:MAG: hypothetical protein Q8L88_15720 [Bacteroidota bacterium]|nr:hypothetical protein [Bacteroidota bacterium]
MKIPNSVYIAREKITEYLLKQREEDDKSKFLVSAGYSLDTVDELEKDLRSQTEKFEAEPFDKTEYGDKYQIRGELQGINGISLKVITIWMNETSTEKWKFITLIPDRKERT